MALGNSGDSFSTGYFLTVRVVDSKTRHPIEGARARIDPLEEPEHSTDVCGRTWWPLKSGTYRLELEMAGYLEKVTTAVIDRKDRSLDILLEAGTKR